MAPPLYVKVLRKVLLQGSEVMSYGRKLILWTRSCTTQKGDEVQCEIAFSTQEASHSPKVGWQTRAGRALIWAQTLEH